MSQRARWPTYVSLLVLLLIPARSWAVVDSFTGTDGTVLSTYSANWGALFSTSVSECRIQTNGVGSNTHAANRYDGRTWASNQYSKVTFTNLSGSYQAVVVRGDSGGSVYTGYMGGIDIDALGHSRYTIWKRVTGTRTTLATHGSQSAVAGDIVKLTVSGTSLTLNVNGSDILSTTDSDIASGDAGILLYGTVGTTTYFDDWDGDDVSVAASPRGLLLGVYP